MRVVLSGLIWKIEKNRLEISEIGINKPENSILYEIATSKYSRVLQ